MKSSEVKHKDPEKKYKSDRPKYLNQLVVEFQTTKSRDAKKEILANLTNFAYDPLNYECFRQLKILDLFLDNLLSQEEDFVKFSIGGLCNLCLDPINRSYVIKNGLERIIKLLEHSNHDVLLSSITTLIFLITPESKPKITCTPVIKAMLKISKETNSRLENLTAVFLEDYCNEEEVKKASSICSIDEMIPISISSEDS